MRLFNSYARVDKSFCEEIAKLLDDMHEVWYDKHLLVGQKWWDEILKQLGESQGFIYLLSAASVKSDYCRNEFALALKLNKAIFPVLIEKNVDIPPDLAQFQYVDMSGGVSDVTAVVKLLTSITVAERALKPAAQPVSPPQISIPEKKDGIGLLVDAENAYAQGDYETLIRRLKEMQQNGNSSHLLDIPSLLKRAEAALNRQIDEREAHRKYAPIAEMMKNETTREPGCIAFREFQASFPNYDPDNLKQICEQMSRAQPPFDLRKSMPLLEWCRVPTGRSAAEGRKKSAEILEFLISKYPVTNAQFQVFVDAPDGYRNPAWWQASLDMQRWYAGHPQPLKAPPNRENHPRTYVCWYEALAFCQWLSSKTSRTIKLPTQQQWQRAARGDNANWRFPWGKSFDPTLCNTKETGLRSTTPVTQYPRSASPYGVCDLLGNAWEWCSNGRISGEITDVNVEILRVVHGGSFITARKNTCIPFHYALKPHYCYDSIGFRIVCETGSEFLG